MLTIDRSASASVFEQLLEQLRYEIVSGRWQVDEQLPSTRVLAEPLKPPRVQQLWGSGRCSHCVGHTGGSEACARLFDRAELAAFLLDVPGHGVPSPGRFRWLEMSRRGPNGLRANPRDWRETRM